MSRGESFGESLGGDWRARDRVGREIAAVPENFGSAPPSNFMDLLSEETRNDIVQWQWCVKVFPGVLTSHLTSHA